MAKADTTIGPRILESAKQEFLALGFQDASLKSICEKAKVTTGALYKRYSGKEDLFSAVVSPTIEALYKVSREKSSINVKEQPDEALIKAWDMDEAYMMWWFRYLYQWKDGLLLLLTCSEGTSYSDFQHDWVEQMTTSTYGFYKEARLRGLTSTDISYRELHILLSSFWTSIYEPFIHGYAWEEIESHCKLVCRLFNWHQVFGFPTAF